MAIAKQTRGALPPVMSFARHSGMVDSPMRRACCAGVKLDESRQLRPRPKPGALPHIDIHACGNARRWFPSQANLSMTHHRGAGRSRPLTQRQSAESAGTLCGPHIGSFPPCEHALATGRSLFLDKCMPFTGLTTIVRGCATLTLRAEDLGVCLRLIYFCFSSRFVCAHPHR